MTRDEFIDGWMQRTSHKSTVRTADGVQVGRIKRVAVECACGAENCKGWAMVSPDFADEYRAFYGPTSPA